MGVGLAIGMDAVRACKAYPWWQSLLVRWCGSVPLPREVIAPSDRDENIASVARFRQLLSELFHGLWIRRRVQVGLPDTSVRVRMLFTQMLPEDLAERRKYLLWRMADDLGVQPDHTRLAYTVLPSLLHGPGHTVLCAVSGEKVIQQYERALAESRVHYSGLTASSILLFNLFHRDLAGPPGTPVLFLAANETSSTTVITLEGCPIFWRARRLTVVGEGASPPSVTAGAAPRSCRPCPPLVGQPPQGGYGWLGQGVVPRRLQVIRRAQELGNVTAACREAGISRTAFYRWRRRGGERYDFDSLDPRRDGARPGRRRQTPAHVERLVIDTSLAWPAWGCRRLASHLAQQGQAQVSPSTVQRILRRAGRGTRRERLLVLEQQGAVAAGLLTEGLGHGAAAPRELVCVADPQLPARAPGGDWRGEILRDVCEAITYADEQLGVGPPARLLVTGPQADGADLADWLAAQCGLPADALDASRRLLRPLPWRLRGEPWPPWGVALAAAAGVSGPPIERSTGAREPEPPGLAIVGRAEDSAPRMYCSR